MYLDAQLGPRARPRYHVQAKLTVLGSMALMAALAAMTELALVPQDATHPPSIDAKPENGTISPPALFAAFHIGARRHHVRV